MKTSLLLWSILLTRWWDSRLKTKRIISNLFPIPRTKKSFPKMIFQRSSSMPVSARFRIGNKLESRASSFQFKLELLRNKTQLWCLAGTTRLRLMNSLKSIFVFTKRTCWSETIVNTSLISIFRLWSSKRAKSQNWMQSLWRSLPTTGSFNSVFN